MKKINESFVCMSCGKQVMEAKRTCRNHCPYCFISRHVDGSIPGDRVAQSTCSGIMIPTEYEIRNGQTKLHFRCTQCGKDHWNKVSVDDAIGDIDYYIAQYKEKYATTEGI